MEEAQGERSGESLCVRAALKKDERWELLLYPTDLKLATYQWVEKRDGTRIYQMKAFSRDSSCFV